MIGKYPGHAWEASSLGGMGTRRHGRGAELLRLVMAEARRCARRKSQGRWVSANPSVSLQAQRIGVMT